MVATETTISNKPKRSASRNSTHNIYILPTQVGGGAESSGCGHRGAVIAQRMILYDFQSACERDFSHHQRRCFIYSFCLKRRRQQPEEGALSNKQQTLINRNAFCGRETRQNTSGEMDSQ